MKEPSTPRIAVPTLDKALQALMKLELGHERAPFLPTQRGWLPSFSSEDANVEHLYEVINPGRSGMSAAELRALFAEDMAGDPSVDEIGQGEDPFEMERQFRSPAGIHPKEYGALYEVLARDEQGEIIGFAEFMVFMEPAEQRLAPLPFPNSAIPPVSVIVSLERIHVLREFRLAGAARALLTYIGCVYRTELEHIARQWAQTFDQTGLYLDITTRVCTAPIGEHANAIHDLLMGIIDDEAALLHEDDADCEELETVDVHEPVDAGLHGREIG